MSVQGDVDVPGVGGVDKRVMFGVVGVAGAFVAWRYYKSRSAAAYDPTQDPNAAGTDPGFQDGGTLPSVSGAVSPTNSYGLPNSSSPPSTDSYGFNGTTNSEWSQYAATQLMQSETWSYTTIVTALGHFLAGKPLDSTDMDIVQAAIALAGPPPEGQHPVIPGGNVPVLVAPTGLSGSAVDDTSVSLHWGAVAGASGYEVYRNGSASVSVDGTSATVGGLSASTKYSFQVAALAAGGTAGPESSAVSVTTKAKPSTGGSKPPTGGGSKPPTSGSHGTRSWAISSQYPTLSQLVAGYNRKYHTSFTWEQIWDYNLAHRSAATVKEMRSRGPNKVFHGTTFEFPY